MGRFSAILLFVCAASYIYLQVHCSTIINNSVEQQLNFPSLADNSSRKEELCSLPVHSGIYCGGPSTKRWYYDNETDSCEIFLYFGCGGNENNFFEKEFCERYCGVKTCPYGGAPARTRHGTSIQTCRRSSQCPSEHLCQSVLIRGDPRTKFCCPLKSYICSLEKAEGRSCGLSAPIERFYYDFSNRSCEPFNFQGCADGNANQFESKEQCETFCHSSACHPGEKLLNDTVNNGLRKCSKLTPCPLGYTCRIDYLTGDRVCCGTGKEEVCPAGYQAYVDSLSGRPKLCPRGTNDCPPDYACFPTDFRGEFVFACCRPITH